MKKQIIFISLIVIIVTFGIVWKFTKTGDSKIFDKANLIRLDFPQPNQVVQSPLVITGEARGSWFFEASFPVTLIGQDGSKIAEGIATAKSEWMTPEFVPFEATLIFTKSNVANNKKGMLILRKDNPSGLPEHDDSLEIQIVFDERNFK